MVLDASVVLKWFAQESDTPSAVSWRERHLREEVLIAVPDLLLYELPNVLHFSKGFTETETLESVGLVREIGVEIVSPTPDLVSRATSLMFARAISFYDASYVALAQLLGAEFVTADRKLVARLGTLPLVTLLS